MFWFRNLISLWQHNTLNFDTIQFKLCSICDAELKNVSYIFRIYQWAISKILKFKKKNSGHQLYARHFATCWGCKDVSTFSICPPSCPPLPFCAPGDWPSRTTAPLPSGFQWVWATPVRWCSSVSSCVHIVFSGSDSKRIPVTGLR